MSSERVVIVGIVFYNWLGLTCCSICRFQPVTRAASWNVSVARTLLAPACDVSMCLCTSGFLGVVGRPLPLLLLRPLDTRATAADARRRRRQRVVATARRRDAACTLLGSRTSPASPVWRR